MDEQAGPGVFFSNNHPGAGGAKGLGPLAETAGDGAAAAGAARAQYSLPGILHFLQHEWARFEVERAQWEVERAELQVFFPFTVLTGLPGALKDAWQIIHPQS